MIELQETLVFINNLQILQEIMQILQIIVEIRSGIAAGFRTEMTASRQE